MKRIIALLLCILLLFAATGCEKGKTPQTQNSKPSDSTDSDMQISLIYCDSDTVNPYTAVKTVNVQLCHLLYEPLIKVDNNFEPIYALAQSAQISGTTCTIKLKKATFTDSSAVTAADVVYSFNLAKGSDTVYAAQTAFADSCTAKDSSTVVFTLKKADPYFLNLLDFPVLKAESDKKTTSDGKVLPPVGCGRYIFNEEDGFLTRNESYYGEKSSISKIKLINAPDSESVSHYVEVGATDVYYTDLADGEIIRMSGKKVSVPLNNLVFIGMNQNYAPLKSLYLRYAISAAVDRSRIAKNAYYTNAVPATGIFHPNFSATSRFQTLETTANSKISIENLEKIGYNKINSGGLRVNSSGSKLSLTLMVNKENQSRVNAAELIAKQLGAVGISVTVDKVTFAQYTARLKSGSFQLYIGEVRILNNMDVSSLVLPSGSAAWGVIEQKGSLVSASSSSATDNAEIVVDSFSNLSGLISGFYSGKTTVADVASGVQTAMPVIPLCFRNGLLFYGKKLSGDITASLSDIYLSFANFKEVF